jgi:nitrogen fixation NifU-like protein
VDNFSWANLAWLGSVTSAALVLFMVIGAWIWYQLKVDPERGSLSAPDATAFLRGKCGDAMKISLKFQGERVAAAKYWTDGCGMSSTCGAAAARLALDKTAEELADIDYMAIEDEVGGLPEEHRHCATLAAATLQEALKHYFLSSEE